MKIIFSWKKQWEALEPHSELSNINQQDVDIISAFLMDSGGLPYLDTIEWLDVLAVKISPLDCSIPERFEWSRESWSAILDSREVTIYSLYNNSCRMKLPLIAFKEIFLSWRDFLLSQPSIENRVVIDLSILNDKWTNGLMD